jgi:DNA polymerase-3 subunit alpha/error-prone DNA polymerase
VLLPLRTKSHFSFGYGTASIPALIDSAAQRGFTSVLLADVDNLCGQFAFHQLCRERRLKPLTGVELRTPLGRLVLVARDREGWSALCRIVSTLRTSYEPLDALDVVAHHRDGLQALSDDVPVLEQLVARMERPQVGALLVRPAHPGSDDAAAAAQRLGLTCFADTDAVMLTPADAPLHELQVAIAGGDHAETPERSVSLASDALFADVPEALAASAKLAEETTLDLCRCGRVLPAVAGTPLWARCGRALAEGRAQGRWTGEVYDRRLAEELNVISTRGLEPYLLLVAETVGYARKRRIELSARGSAVGSLVVHLLGASDIDPITHGLLFERFLNVGRDDPPDVDLDVESGRRSELIDFVHRCFGKGHVAMVSAHVTYQLRSALRAALPALGLPEPDANRLFDALPAHDLGLEQVAPLLPPRLRPSLSLIARLVGQPRHLSVHPGGVVAADCDLAGIVPLERVARGTLCTQLDLRSVGEAGLLKLDLVGNRCLTEVGQAAALAGLPSRGAIPETDTRTLEALDGADTLGCFQVETPPMRSLLVRLPIQSLADCTAALGMVRPGLASGEGKDSFIRRALGEEPPLAVHPAVADLLEESRGLLLYEEDLIRVLARAGGLSITEADGIRSALTKGAPVAELGRGFVEHAPDRALAAAVWPHVARFAAHAFNKAQALSYARLAFESVYMKVHHPLELGAALLDHYGGHYPLRTIAWELQRKGVTLLAPHVNRSELGSSLEEGRLRLGLSRVKRLRQRTALSILDERPFKSLSELMDRVKPGLRELEALILCGACDGLEPLRAEAFPVPHRAVLAQLGSQLKLAKLERWPELARVHLELTFLEMSISGHPLKLLREEATRAGCVSTQQVREGGPERVRIAGTLAASRPVETKGGATMQFLTFEDEDGLLEAVLFPPVRASQAKKLTTPGPYLAEGIVERDRGDVQLDVEWLTPFYQRRSS